MNVAVAGEFLAIVAIARDVVAAVTVVLEITEVLMEVVVVEH